jgi:hypothetical protein
MSDLYQPHSALDLLQRFESNSEARRRFFLERFDCIRDAQSLRPQPYSGRILLRIRRGGCGWIRSLCDRFTNRWFHDQAGLVLRRGRLQANLRSTADVRHEMLLVVV